MVLPKIGILADDRLQQHILKQSLLHFGFDVVINTDPERMDLLDISEFELDAWLVDLRDESGAHMYWLERLLDADAPVLLGFERAPDKNSHIFPKWEKRLYSKLREMLHSTPVVAADTSALERLGSTTTLEKITLPPVFAEHDFRQQPATQVWVLGASLGGPEAVKAFLDALPGGLPVAFIYAQHIDARFESTLAATIGRHCEYVFLEYKNEMSLFCGEVLVAPVAQEFRFDGHQKMHSLNKQWAGPYGPSIDQVVLNVEACYGSQAGYILFSGMGNDGSESLMSLPLKQTNIWAQTPETCANGSMPESAIETRRVTYTGDPYQLALQFVNHIHTTWVNGYESIIKHH